MSDRRLFRWATTSARLLVGTVVSVAAVVAVVTAVTVAWPGLMREPVRVVAAPAPAPTVLSCAGGLLAVGGDPADPSVLQVAADQAVTSGVAEGASEPQLETLAVVDLDVQGPVALRALPQGDERTDAGAAGSASVRTDDLVGFAASACRPPLMESWLVAGSAATGAADLVLLANPGTVAATVQLTVFGAAGPQSPPGGTDLIVPAGSQVIVPLAGIALGESTPMIRVTAQGTPIQASVQSSITRVLLPGGVEQTGAVAASAERQTMPGVQVTQQPGEDGASDAATVVRLLSPGTDGQATVTVRAVGAQEEAVAPVTVPLAAGIPTEVALGGLAVGGYVIDVVADTPVVAGVWQAAGFGEDADFAWYTPAPLLPAATLFAVPDGPSPTLTVVNTGDAPATVVVDEVDGADVQQVDLAPGASASIPLRQRAVYLLDAGGLPVQASMSLAASGAIAGYPIWPADADAPPMTVYP
jgi:hypothetical protein